MRESNKLKTFLNQEQGLAWFGCINLFPRELAVSKNTDQKHFLGRKKVYSYRFSRMSENDGHIISRIPKNDGHIPYVAIIFWKFATF